MPVDLPGAPETNDVALLDDRAYRWTSEVWQRDPANDGEAPPPEFDSFTAVETSYGGSITSDGEIAIATRFEPVTGTVTLHGLRWWRSTTSQSTAPIAYGALVGAGTAAVSKVSPAGAGAPDAAGWETILFDSPVSVSSEYVVWVWIPSGGYAATAAYFAGENTPSIDGLIDTTGTTQPGRYAQPPGGTNGNGEPGVGFGTFAYYWVTPLVA